MAHLQPVQCAECRMFSHSSSVASDSFICDKCRLVSSLTEKIIVLEARIHALEKVNENENGVVSVGESLDARGGVSNPPTPALEPLQRGEWVTTQRHKHRAKATTEARPREHHSSPRHVSNRFALLSDATTEKPERALVIGDSIIRHVKLAQPLGAPAALVRCILGARVPDIGGNLRVLGKHRFSKIVIHAGANDIRLRQSEVTKSNFVEVFKLGKAMSDAVVCSGPIPMRRGNVAYSRLWSLNCWLSRWCSENSVGFIDNWANFEGTAGLLGRDRIHPTREGAALISCSIGHSLRTGLVNF
ncbi:uncharacterized protein LOC132872794 [Neoarius graeffei]|uniref:uncharacterized protein LOC132872794 n=1 Tax=Neoarius graeffei TaxID=443677 RepID=UPI00298CDBB5|nr:uncharacterized protein LOC132872794 [Neoarius graeffei]XP_060763864.1 uncharacterized protein LOC132872794 [Neoarius graeffei]XP_060763865.1 uncharacterized protein LOC132872794 [Neoarius graeffei]